MPHSAQTLWLFVPCFIDELYPWVALAAYRFLQHSGWTVHYIPHACCGQPPASAGNTTLADQHAHNLLAFFKKNGWQPDQPIIVLSASCRKFLHEAWYNHRQSIYEFSEWLVKTQWQPPTHTQFRIPHCVLVHGSCSAVWQDNLYVQLIKLLRQIPELHILTDPTPGSCCGFGGVFSVREPAISLTMGLDKLLAWLKPSNHQPCTPTCIVSTDMSCLMHLEGILTKHFRQSLTFLHIAELLLSGYYHGRLVSIQWRKRLPART